MRSCRKRESPSGNPDPAKTPEGVRIPRPHGFSAGGSVKSIRTTPLISMEDGVRAMEIAQTSTYAPALASVPA